MIYSHESLMGHSLWYPELTSLQCHCLTLHKLTLHWTATDHKPSDYCLGTQAFQPRQTVAHLALRDHKLLFEITLTIFYIYLHCNCVTRTNTVCVFLIRKPHTNHTIISVAEQWLNGI